MWVMIWRSHQRVLFVFIVLFVLIVFIVSHCNQLDSLLNKCDGFLVGCSFEKIKSVQNHLSTFLNLCFFCFFFVCLFFLFFVCLCFFCFFFVCFFFCFFVCLFVFLFVCLFFLLCFFFSLFFFFLFLVFTCGILLMFCLKSTKKKRFFKPFCLNHTCFRWLLPD